MKTTHLIIFLLLIAGITGAAVNTFSQTPAQKAESARQEIIEQINEKLSELQDSLDRESAILDTQRNAVEDLKTRIIEAKDCLTLNSHTGSFVTCEIAKDKIEVTKPTIAKIIPQASALDIEPFDPSETLRKIQYYRPNWDDPEKCKGFEMQKVKQIELHYTATPYDTTVENIWKAHSLKNGTKYYAGYHYLITSTGAIVNVRPETCGALADKSGDNNLTNIHISWIGNDKPTDAQTRAIVTLTRHLQNHYWLTVDDVTSHAHEDRKSYKENTKYWYGSHENFLTLLAERDTKILFRKKENSLVQFAYNISGGDMDFMTTVAQESGWRIDAVGDGGKAVGLCQYNTDFNPILAHEYLALKDPLDQVRHCLAYYQAKSEDPRGVGNFLHGYNARGKRVKEFTFLP